MAKLKSYYNLEYFEARDIVDVRIAEGLRILMDQAGFESVLDVGCGSGWLVKYLSECGYKARGCDNAEVALKLAEKKVRKQLLKAGATRLPYSKGSFDVVSSISMVEHLSVKEVRSFLKEVTRVLKPGGVVFLVTPNFGSPFRIIQGKNWFGYSDPTHINFYTSASLGKELREAGFKDLETKFKTIYNSSFDYDLPGLGSLPQGLKALAVFLLFSSPLSSIRNSIWMSGRKP